MSRTLTGLLALLAITALVTGICVHQPMSAWGQEHDEGPTAGDCDPNYASLDMDPAKCVIDEDPWCVTTAGCVPLATPFSCPDGSCGGSGVICEYGKFQTSAAHGSCQTTSQLPGFDPPCTKCEKYICADGHAWAGLTTCIAPACPSWWMTSQKCNPNK